ncbi:hypothetical protein Smic_61640 [Streptomyces microflavus]|uniref:Uncharacterized protein n=1 Tax=Streptomyces microflavus TaxID=1919 RepID=A0A7J0CYW6_STRMI|nr:hypothetical protein Smic_61640 [Streptomyces microflavus]
MGFEPPQRLVRALGEMYGDGAAAEWLDRLPTLTEQAIDAAGPDLSVERAAAPAGAAPWCSWCGGPTGPRPR